MRPVRQTVVGIGVSPPVPCDRYISPFQLSLAVDLIGATAATYTVEYTLDDVFAAGFNPATAKWWPHVDLTAKTADDDGTIISPVTAVRLNVAASDGSVQMTTIQAGLQ